MPCCRSDPSWLRWIHASLMEDDLRMASHARRALVNMAAASADRGASAVVIPDGVHLMTPDARFYATPGGALFSAPALPFLGFSGECWPARPGILLEICSRCSRVPAEAPAGEPAAGPAAEPEIDIVFVHGLRGGGFITWRIESQQPPQQQGPEGPSEALPPAVVPTSSRKADPAAAAAARRRGYVSRSQSWPSAWLGAELPEARILSLEYSAPATDGEARIPRRRLCLFVVMVELGAFLCLCHPGGTALPCRTSDPARCSFPQGHTLPFEQIAARFLDKLTAAGVGRRPVVFVTHSLGGLLVKEIMLQSERAATAAGPSAWPSRGSLASESRGVVFYSCPHFGSWLADWGWQLKRVGGQPSAHVAQARGRGLCSKRRLVAGGYALSPPCACAHVRRWRVRSFPRSCARAPTSRS